MKIPILSDLMMPRSQRIRAENIKLAAEIAACERAIEEERQNAIHTAKLADLKAKLEQMRAGSPAVALSSPGDRTPSTPARTSGKKARNESTS